MPLNTAVMFGKASDEWTTPRDFFDALDLEFQFVLDAAATNESKLARMYLGPDHVNEFCRDALTRDWSEIVGSLIHRGIWLNPPYSKCREFIGKAAAEAQRGATVVCLIPSRTDTRWWHEHVWDRMTHACRPGVEVRFVKGRLKFGGASTANSAPFPSVAVIFRPVK